LPPAPEFCLSPPVRCPRWPAFSVLPSSASAPPMASFGVKPLPSGPLVPTPGLGSAGRRCCLARFCMVLVFVPLPFCLDVVIPTPGVVPFGEPAGSLVFSAPWTRVVLQPRSVLGGVAPCRGRCISRLRPGSGPHPFWGCVHGLAGSRVACRHRHRLMQCSARLVRVFRVPPAGAVCRLSRMCSFAFRPRAFRSVFHCSAIGGVTDVVVPAAPKIIPPHPPTCLAPVWAFAAGMGPLPHHRASHALHEARPRAPYGWELPGPPTWVPHRADGVTSGSGCSAVATLNVLSPSADALPRPAIGLHIRVTRKTPLIAPASQQAGFSFVPSYPVTTCLAGLARPRSLASVFLRPAFPCYRPPSSLRGPPFIPPKLPVWPALVRPSLPSASYSVAFSNALYLVLSTGGRGGHKPVPFNPPFVLWVPPSPAARGLRRRWLPPPCFCSPPK